MSTMALAGVMGWTVSNAGAQIVLTPPVGSTQSPPNPSIASLGSGMYGWTYSISLGPDTSVSNGDSVAIVDFGGYIGTPTLTVSLSSNFTVSQTGAYLAGGLQDTNPLAYGYNNPSVSDVVLTYTGSGLQNTNSLSDTLLGTITLVTDTNTVKTEWVSSKSAYYPSGSPDEYSAAADVPAAPLPVPLPAAFWPGLGTMAAMALAGGLKLRKKFA